MKQLLKDLFTNKYFYISLIVFTVGVVLNQTISRGLMVAYGTSLPILNDYVLSRIPYLNTVWLYDLFLVFSTGLFFVYVYKKDASKIPYFILLFGIIQFIRGTFIGLTPFGNPKVNPEFLGLFNGTAFKMGVYPSGHTGSTFMAFLLARGWWRYALLGCSVIVMAFLLLGRGHYSIDILSAILFSWGVFCFGEIYFKDKFTLKEKN